MLRVTETSVYHTNRFFNKLPMTDLCKNTNISKLKVGPPACRQAGIRGPDTFGDTAPRAFNPACPAF
ncbi:hypothetical protein DDZ16_05190 [Marinilabilia rubra]|uniref:Uncharacterized protein n=1 Tax=Marinilabilia rubra TaxID=2162893 RepID=A0A2U2BB98_9BACT|nr:hypothetical protein DDZ16_05190 [Marinilabilia rubra]